MHFGLVSSRILLAILISAVFRGPALIRGEARIKGRHLFEVRRLLEEIRYMQKKSNRTRKPQWNPTLKIF